MFHLILKHFDGNIIGEFNICGSYCWLLVSSLILGSVVYVLGFWYVSQYFADLFVQVRMYLYQRIVFPESTDFFWLFTC